MKKNNMNKKIFFLILFLILILIGGYYLYKKSKSQESSIPEISYIEENFKITSPYAFATIPNAKTAAAFLTIKNLTGQDDALIEVQSNIAEIAEIHQNYVDSDSGTMMMRKIKKLNLPNGSETSLDPKKYHIMFINLKDGLKVGDNFPLTLVFENGAEKTVTVDIVTPGITPHSQH